MKVPLTDYDAYRNLREQERPVDSEKLKKPTREKGLILLNLKIQPPATKKYTPKFIMEELFKSHNWALLQDALLNLPKNEQDAYKNHFNGLIEGENDLGDQLFGNLNEFESDY